MAYSKRYFYFQWIILVSIYLVIVAGSFVRISGSGMGCPDWPKCFNQWIPPTDSTVLPNNYKEIYLEKRLQKIDRFTEKLEKYGFAETAHNVKNDPNLKMEEAFNAQKTWTEYVNRLLGFLCGNLVLISFIWTWIYYRKSVLLYFAFVNVILMGLQGWFGSIVVASNLVPWTITVHMLLALLIVMIQIFLIHRSSPKIKNVNLSKWKIGMVWAIFLITFYQMFLGTQVREIVDELVREGVPQSQWIEEAGLPFLIHRSFSWLVLVLISILAYSNFRSEKNNLINFMFVVLAIELFSGILLAYVEMPGLVRTAHLLFSTVLFGGCWYLILQSKNRHFTG